MPQEGDMTKHAAPPESLGKPGSELWKSIAGKYELRPDELAVLKSACKTEDMISLLEAEWVERGRPMMSKGSMGQEVTHPLLAEQKSHQAAQAALLAKLKLPDEPTAGAGTNQQRQAAQTR